MADRSEYKSLHRVVQSDPGRADAADDRRRVQANDRLLDGVQVWSDLPCGGI